MNKRLIIKSHLNFIFRYNFTLQRDSCQQTNKKIVYILKRMDDSGNSYIIEKFDNKQNALNSMSKLNKYQHKQWYWIDEEFDKNIQNKHF